jgi:hypothetical protein
MPACLPARLPVVCKFALHRAAVGDQVPADLRMVQLLSNLLRVDQVGLMTGEEPEAVCLLCT